MAVKKSRKRVIFVDEHHRLLPAINRSRCNTVVNIDQHSDIVESEKYDPPDLNCGTWANYVHRRGHFIWFSPPRYYATCHTGKSPFEYPEVAGWEKVSWYKVKQPPIGLINSASHIGLSMSYEYISATSLLPFVVKKVFNRRPRRSQAAMTYWHLEEAKEELSRKRNQEIFQI